MSTRIPWLYRVVRDRSGQSEPIAVVLLMLVVVMGTATVFISGSAAITDGRKEVSVAQAEQAFAALDSKTSLVGLAETERQRVNLGLDESDGTVRATDDGHILIEMVDADGNTTIINKQLGTILYEHDETTVAYQGGGVWRTDGDGTVMVSRPEFHYRDATLTVPILSVSGDSTLSNDVYITASSTSRVYPDPDNLKMANEVPKSEIWVTITSEYYESWYQYFAETTNAELGINHATQKVRVMLDATPEFVTFSEGLFATSGNNEITIQGTGNYLDSYDSVNGAYNSSQTGEFGTISAMSDITASGNSEFTGTLKSGGDIQLSGSSKIVGDVYYTDTFCLNEMDCTPSLDPDTDVPADVVSGEVRTDPYIRTIDPIDSYVVSRITAIQAANDNDRADATLIDGTQLDFKGADVGTLTAGTYSLEQLVLDKQKLVLDTSEGDITIAVAEDIKLSSVGSGYAAINVKGDNNVLIFVGGTPERPDLSISKKSKVRVPEQNSEQLRIYGTQDFDVVMNGDSSKTIVFEGVIFAPAGDSGTGMVTISHVELYGAIVTGSLDINNDAAFHYDEALGEVKFRVATDGTTVSFLHVSTHDVVIEDS